MTTIPARLAQVSRTSSNILHARRRAIQLYRDWYRAVGVDLTSLTLCSHSLRFQAPEIVSLYALNVSASQIRHAVRQRFERTRFVTDPRVIDVLLLKGRQEFQETLNCWKQPDHVLGILLQQNERPHKTFLERFYEGSCRLPVC